MVTILALDGLTKKHFGYYALLKIFPLRSPSTQDTDQNLLVSHVSTFLAMQIFPQNGFAQLGHVQMDNGGGGGGGGYAV